MLAINVSIPNLTVARLEQFPSRQMTDNKPSFTRKLHVVIFRQGPFAANAVPKLVAMATSLRPRSRLCEDVHTKHGGVALSGFVVAAIGTAPGGRLSGWELTR